MKVYFSLLTFHFSLLWVLGNSVIAQVPSKAHLNTGRFPESWDPQRTMRGQKREVLAWGQFRDGRPYEFRNCLTLGIYVDSLGKKEYSFSQEYSNEKPFDKWHIGSIHYGPAEDELIGYYDVHLKVFDHRPSEQEIHDLLQKWHFSLVKDRFETVEHGMDKRLWRRKLGFVPDLMVVPEE